MYKVARRKVLFVIGLISLIAFQIRSESISIMCNDTLDIDLIGVDVAKGDSVCIDLVFNNFTNVNSLQFSINWDPSVLSFSSLHDVNPGGVISEFYPSAFGLFAADQGVIRFLWYDPNVDGESAPDGFVAARLCFKAVGAPGDQTDIVISDIPLKFEAEDPNGDPFCLEDDGDQTIRITLPTDLCVVTTSCASRTNNGIITVKPWGGQPPYTIDIPSIGVAGDVLNNQGDCAIYDMLNPGSYTIVVTDGAGADTIIMVVIMNTEPVIIDTVQLESPTCKGDENGRIEIDVRGGAPPYSINWSPISATGQTRITRLPSGQYSVTVKDSLGCTSSATFDLDSDLLSVDTNLIQLVSCSGQNDGILEVIPSGGTPFAGGTYQFTWSQNPAANGRYVTSTNNMVGGQGSVIIQDAAGCVDTVFYNIPATSEIDLQVSIDSVLCHGDSTGRITLIATTNGMSNPPYLFILRRPSGLPVTGGSVLLNEYRHNNLWAGTFTLRLDDASGCVYRDTFTIHEPDPVEMRIVSADTSAGCNPDNNAFIEVEGTAGSGGPFSYQWDYQNQTGPLLDSLPAGQYTVVVSDKNNCSISQSYNVSAATGPVITGFDIKGIGCAGDTSGEITVNYITGDTTVQSITWNNNRTGDMITGLSEGEYIVTITDNNGCTAIDTAIIDIPSTSIRITSVIIDTPSCNGSFDGFLQLNVDGGVKPYTFQWSSNHTDSILTNIGAGRYIIAIRDQSNCPPIVDTFDIPEPPAITINLLSVDGVTCNNDTTCDGRAIAVASDGPDASAGYNFLWSSGEIGRSSPDTAVGLCKGQQLLIVANGDCVDSVFFDVPAPDPLSVDFAASEFIKPSCAGRDDGSIAIVSQGGTGNRVVRWDFGPVSNQINNLFAGVYHFVVEDDNGCMISDSIDLKDPDSLNAFVLDAASRDITCPGGNDGRIVVSWNGGNSGKATFNWSPGVTTDSTASDLSSGQYLITVTDSKGCIDTLIYQLMEPPAIVADFPFGDSVDCYGAQLPVTVVAAMGGNGPDYTYAINNGPRRNLGEEISLFAGSYRISVFDKDGCRIDSMLTIHQPTEINVDLGTPEIELDLGDSLRLCFQTNIPNSEIDSIVWRPSAPLADPDGRCIWVKVNNDITYYVEVYNSKGCVALDQIRIRVNKSRRVFAPNAFNPNGNVNTTWKVFTGKGVDFIDRVSIYDRWGELVYQVDRPDASDGWNGNFQNTTEPLPNGVYVYVVEVKYLDGSVETRKGDITLFR